jgi:hypothetical protein
MAKLDVKALGLSLGITWGLSVILMGLICMMSGWGSSFVDAMGKFYVGYKPTLLGSLTGGILGFLDMGIGGVIIAWLYNKFAK